MGVTTALELGEVLAAGLDEAVLGVDDVLSLGLGGAVLGVGDVLTLGVDALTLRLGEKLAIALLTVLPQPAVRHTARIAVIRSRP